MRNEDDIKKLLKVYEEKYFGLFETCDDFNTEFKEIHDKICLLRWVLGKKYDL